MSKQLHPIYLPQPGQPMRVAVFGSGSGTTLEALLRAPSSLFQLSLLFTDRPCRFQQIAKEASLPLIFHPFDAFCQKRGFHSKDPQARLVYDEEAAALLDQPIDLVLLAGYMRILSPPLLQRFERRILNTHPADLTAVDLHNQRKYIGANAVAKALRSGEKRTRSCVILVDASVDGGPILVSGPWVDVITEESASCHQQRQKRLSDYPACLSALQWVAEGRLSLDDSSTVFFDHSPQPSCGVDLANPLYKGAYTCAALLDSSEKSL